MTPLQQAAQAIIEQCDSPSWKVNYTASYILTLRKALEAEMQQAVEPVFWVAPHGTGFRVHMGSTKPDYARLWEPLYTHPAPPPAGERDHVPDAGKMVGERAELIAKLRKALEAEMQQAVEPVAWLVKNEYVTLSPSLAKAWDSKGVEVRPLYLHPAPPPIYDQQALELCDVCGWKAIMPGEPCFVCSLQTEAQQ